MKKVKKKPTTQLLVTSVSLKRSEQFVRSDALSPNAVNRLSMESELEKLNEGKTSVQSIDDKEIIPKNNNEINMEFNFSNKKGLEGKKSPRNQTKN